MLVLDLDLDLDLVLDLDFVLDLDLDLDLDLVLDLSTSSTNLGSVCNGSEAHRLSQSLCWLLMRLIVDRS